MRLDAADRLVELVEERRGPVPAADAARSLFALASAPAGLARSLLGEVVESDARLVWTGAHVALAGAASEDLPLEAATFVVVDLETTGLSARTSEICEIGAVRLRGLETAGTFETFVRPRMALAPVITQLTGIRNADLRGAPSADVAMRRFLAFAGDCVLVAHNARFDMSFLDRAVERMESRRLAAPVLDTVPLARALLNGRAGRTSLASLSRFFGTSVQPCHRALADAQATAEILVALIGMAQERGAVTVADLQRLAAPRARQAHDKRSLAFGAPTRPGVYLFRGPGDQVLYVGRARNIRQRLRSYFGTERQRPAVEAALAALERIEWRVTGSEVEAALDELRLIRELRPPGNARGLRPDRYAYLERRDDGIRLAKEPTALGPLKSRRRAELTVRALAQATPQELDGLTAGAPLAGVRARLTRLAAAQRYEDAARMRDRLSALEAAIADLRELERLRALQVCLLVPALDDGFRTAVFVAGGRVASVRRLARNAGAAVEAATGVAEAPPFRGERVSRARGRRRPPLPGDIHPPSAARAAHPPPGCAKDRRCRESRTSDLTKP